VRAAPDTPAGRPSEDLVENDREAWFPKGSVSRVTDQVDDDSVRVADEEAPRAPRILGQRVDYLVATLASL
jgi:hypothetical protein